MVRTMKKRMIHAKVDCDLLMHMRVLIIPIQDDLRMAALGAWLWCLLYTVKQQLDGFVPGELVRAVASENVLNRLVDVGLLARDEQNGVHGFTLRKYAEHNFTRAEIGRLRKKDRLRKKRNRIPDSVHPESSSSPSGALPESIESHGNFPLSLSLSVSKRSDPDPEGVPEPPSRPPPKLSPMPSWADEVAQGVVMHLGPFDKTAQWAAFQASGKPQTPEELQRWFVKSATFARAQRERSRDLEREKAARETVTLPRQPALVRARTEKPPMETGQIADVIGEALEALK